MGNAHKGLIGYGGGGGGGYGHGGGGYGHGGGGGSHFIYTQVGRGIGRAPVSNRPTKLS